MTGARVRVPATAANLGPGYDSFGLALDLHNTFEATPADGWKVEFARADNAGLPADERNPVVRAMQRAYRELGRAEVPARLVCDNAVPTGRGLGSSAAAIVGGLMLGAALCDARFACDELVRLATAIEGHPDNVAAAVLGGFTITTTEAGVPVARSMPLAAGLAAVLAIAEEPFQTSDARDLLPQAVPHADAAFNASHAAVLTAGLLTGNAGWISDGLHDRLHEQYRESALPGFDGVARALVTAGAAGAVLSGAGPTVLALVTAADDEQALAGAREVARSAAGPVAAAGAYRAPVAVSIDRRGAVLG